MTILKKSDWEKVKERAQELIKNATLDLTSANLMLKEAERNLRKCLEQTTKEEQTKKEE